MVESSFGDDAQEFFWEDDLYQLNQNEADDYRNEANDGGRIPQPQFELGEYRIVMGQLAKMIEDIDGRFNDELLGECLEALIQAGYYGYELMYSESYDEYTDMRINTLIDGVKSDAINMLRSFDGGGE
jgi:hypothetical protein